MKFSSQAELENAIKNSQLPDDQPMLPVVNDHYSDKIANLPLEHNSKTTDDAGEQDTENTMEQRILKPSKSDSSLSVRDKTSSISSDEGFDLEPSKPTSKSNHELSTGGRTVPNHLQLENPSLRPQAVYKVSPTRGTDEVPITSYSSSEDEDDAEFFDADEYHDLESNMSRSVLTFYLLKGHCHAIVASLLGYCSTVSRYCSITVTLL